MDQTSERTLRAVVEKRLGVRWQEWSQQHPNLAQVLDRTQLMELAVQRIAQREGFERVMRQAAADEARMDDALWLLEQVDAVVRELLPI